MALPACSSVLSSLICSCCCCRRDRAVDTVRDRAQPGRRAEHALCAFDCARRSWRGVPRPHLVHYNYGSPRVGNEAFADEVR